MACLPAITGCAADPEVEVGLGRLEAAGESTAGTIWKVYSDAAGSGWLLSEEAPGGIPTGRYVQAAPNGAGGTYIAVQTYEYFADTEFNAAREIVGDLPPPESVGELTELGLLLAETFTDGTQPTGRTCSTCAAGGWQVAVIVVTIAALVGVMGCGVMAACFTECADSQIRCFKADAGPQCSTVMSTCANDECIPGWPAAWVRACDQAQRQFRGRGFEAYGVRLP